VTKDLLDIKLINSRVKAYLLGFIAADGCLYHNKGCYTLEIELAQKDKEHLEKINFHLTKNFIQIRERERKGYRSVRLFITNKTLSSNLQRHGIVPAKSLILQPPKISPKFVSHWIRGYFDGDGCITYGKTKSGEYLVVKLLGTLEIVSFIDSWFRTISDIKFKSGPYQHGKVWLIIYKRKVGEIFLQKIYHQANLFLDRKHSLAQKHIS
jgi:intein/homing endonuclease